MTRVIFALLTVLTANVFASSPPVACADASSHGGYTIDQAVRLCSGASSNAPFSCAEEAYKNGVSTVDQAVELCVGAVSNSPITCFTEAISIYTVAQAVRLCRSR